MDQLPKTRAEVITVSILVEGGLVLGAYPLGWLLGIHPLSNFVINWHDSWVGMVATLPLLPIFLIMIHGSIPFLGKLKTISKDTIRPMMRRCTIPDLLGISLLAGVGEEMVFRGVLQTWLAQDSPPWAAVMAAGLSFGMMHSMSKSYFVLATLVGAYLGFLFVWTGNLIAPIMVHFLYDAFALYYLTRVWKPYPNEEQAPIPDEEIDDDFSEDMF